MTIRILVARLADAANLNAQAKNAQEIVGRWRSDGYRPSILAYGDPDPKVAFNANVDVLQLRHGRAWRPDLFLKYLGPFDGIFYPGLHERIDCLALRARALFRRKVPVISTVEGLMGNAGDSRPERAISALVGHEVHPQKVEAGRFDRGEAILRMADHIIAISPFLARVATRLYGEKVSMLPIGVDLTRFRRLAWPRRPRMRVVSAGHVQAHKRPEVFVRLAATFPQADFVWFGGAAGEKQNRLLDAARDIPNLEFPGAVSPDRLAREFANSDIFVLPSLGEGVPKVTQEAAASGLAQIIFGHYESPTVRHGANGFVVWSDDELCQRLGQLLEDRALVEQMGRHGVEMAEAWSWDLVAPQWERRIIDVVHRGRFRPASDRVS